MKKIIYVVAMASVLATQALSEERVGEVQVDPEFVQQLRAVLQAEPEIVADALDLIEQRKVEAQNDIDRQRVSEYSESLFESATDYQFGPEDASVTMVKFVDYNCGFCRQVHNAVQSAISIDDDVRYIVKEFPVLGEASEMASRFAIATLRIYGPETYRSVNDMMLTATQPVDAEFINEILELLELDSATLVDAAYDDVTSETISGSYTLASALEVRGTPTFIINDRIVRGAIPLQEFLDLFETVREEQ